MTWDELRKIHEWLPKTSEGWHQHANGGGWVCDTAKVAESAWIAESAVVGNYCTLGKDCTLGDCCTLGNGCTLGDYCKLGNYCKLGDRCKLGNGCKLGNDCELGNYCKLGDCCKLGNGCTLGDGCTLGNLADAAGDHPRSPIYIQGTRYWIGYHSPGMIASGCITKPAAWWLENVERCAEEHGYTEEQQREYRLHVEHIAAWMKLYGVFEEPNTEDEK